MSLLQKVRILTFLAVATIPLGGLATPGEGKGSIGGNEARAAEAFERGQSLYNNREYLEAAIEFEKAYRLAPHPSVLANIGYCYDKIGDYPKAMEALRKYVQNPNPKTRTKNAKIAKYLAEMKSKVGELKVSCLPTRCEVTVDGNSSGVTPTTILLRTGKHAVRVAPVEGGQQRQFNVDVPGGGELVLDVDLTTRHPVAAEDVPSERGTDLEKTRLRAPFWVATSTAIAGFCATAVLVGVGYKTREDFRGGGSTDPTLKRRGENLVMGINIAAGVTAAAAATAVILAIIDVGRKPAKEGQRSETNRRAGKLSLEFSPGPLMSLRLSF